MSAPRILAFAGSARRDSFNKKLVKIAARGAIEAGAMVTVIDLADYAAPLFDEDLEKKDGLPPAILKLKELAATHDAFLIASPEYNSSLTALLKNTLDWISRPAPNETPMAAFRQKTAAIVAASPGALGGLRGLVHLRAILGSIGVLVIPEQFALSRAFEAFDEKGEMKDAKQAASAMAVGKALAAVTQKLRA